MGTARRRFRRAARCIACGARGSSACSTVLAGSRRGTARAVVQTRQRGRRPRRRRGRRGGDDAASAHRGGACTGQAAQEPSRATRCSPGRGARHGERRYRLLPARAAMRVHARLCQRGASPVVRSSACRTSASAPTCNGRTASQARFQARVPRKIVGLMRRIQPEPPCRVVGYSAGRASRSSWRV